MKLLKFPPVAFVDKFMVSCKQWNIRSKRMADSGKHVVIFECGSSKSSGNKWDS